MSNEAVRLKPAARTRPEYLRWLAQDAAAREPVGVILEAAAVLCEQIEESTHRICMELRDLDYGR